MNSISNQITFVTPYYENKEMLKEQIRIWNTYPAELLRSMEFIVVDDCSSIHPLRSVLHGKGVNVSRLRLRSYRIKKRMDWNWQSCRNLGAHEASSEWLFMTDIDHALCAEDMVKLHSRRFEPDCFFRFPRRNVRDGTMCDTHHPNVYFISKKLFWKVGGHDESFAGTYGNDGEFRKRLLGIATEKFLEDCTLMRYSAALIHDCTSHDLPKRDHPPYLKLRKQIIEEKKRNGNTIKSLSYPWERLA